MAREGTVRESDSQYMTRCPCHEDKTASLAVRLSPDGSLLLHCFGGCTSTKEGYIRVKEALGVEGGALSPPAEATSPAPAPLPPLSLDLIEPLTEAGYGYLLAKRGVTKAVAQGHDLGRSCARLAIPIGDKDKAVVDIRLCLPPEARDGKTQPKIRSWERGRGGSRLFPLPTTPDILLCGGELDALCAISQGYPAVTTTGSESSFPRKLAQQLSELGVKTAHVLLDNDETGEIGTKLRVERLKEVGIAAAPIYWPANTDQKWDICDEVKASGHLGRIL